MPAGPMSRAGGTAAHADGPRVVAERRGRPQMTGAASADERGVRAGPRLAGARVDGGLRGPACAAREARVRRWVRIWSITDVWVMQATRRIAPWQDGHASGSTSLVVIDPVIRTFANAATDDLLNGLDSRRARRACPARLWPSVARTLTQLNRVRE